MMSPQTSQLRLELLRDDRVHAALYRELYTCPKVMASIGAPLTPAAADAAFAIACRHNAPAMPGHRYWAIVECDTGRPLGLAALQRRGPQGEFGIMVRVEAWKRRVASRALGLVLEYGFGLLELDTIVVESLGGAHGRMMHRLVAPFGFQPVQGRAARMRAWALPRSRWAQRPPPSGWIFQGPRRRVKES